MCKHMNFTAKVTVARLEDSGQFQAEVTIKCTECGEDFQFLGLEPGLDLNGASVSIDGKEARLAILPNSQVRTPFHRMLDAARRKGGEP